MPGDDEFLPGLGDHRDGFTVAAGRSRVTVGINLWNKIFVVKNSNIDGGEMAVLLIDTQGLWDSQTSPTTNFRIFGMSCLLSSFLIFNLDGGVVSTDFTTNLALLTQVANRGENVFQDFSLLVRDCGDIDPAGSDLNEVIHVSNQVRDELETNEQSSSTYNILQTCFQTVSCFCLPIPGCIKHVGYDGRVAAINLCFRESLAYYIEQVICTVKPRTIDGTPMLPPLFELYNVDLSHNM